MFCSGTAALPDGRSLVVGGTSDYSFTGENRASIFDPRTGKFAQSQNMVDGRWYGTATTLGDGRVMAMSGLTLTGGTSTTVEIYDLENAGAGWRPPTSVPFHSAALPARLSAAEWEGLLYGTGKRRERERLDLRPHERHLDSFGRDDGRSDLWLVRYPAAAAAQLHSAGHELRRRQSRQPDDRDHRPVRGLSDLDARS